MCFMKERLCLGLRDDLSLLFRKGRSDILGRKYVLCNCGKKFIVVGGGVGKGR